MSDDAINWDKCLRVSDRSDVGMRRSNNQDSRAVAIAADDETWRTRGHVFLVADGMGAHAAGELASEITAERVPHLYLKYRDQSAPEALQRAIIDTNSEVNRRGRANPDFHNMGTTCSVMTLLPQGAVLGHVGDSRVYRLRGDSLEQLTFDHSLVWEMRAAGQLSEGDAMEAIVPKNVITRSLGPNATVKVDIEGPFPLEVGDTFLLCSDGLTGPVKDEELGPILGSLEPEEATQLLIDLANLRGGPDNITVIVAKVIGPEMATNQAGDEPITLRADKNVRKTPYLLWVLMAACFLAAAGMAILQSWLAAGLSALGGFVFLITIVIQYIDFRPGGVSLRAGQRFGKGPYTKVAYPANAEFVAVLADVVAQLREGALEQNWNVDWDKFDGLASSAQQATDGQQFQTAVRQHSRTICFMMEQLRNRRASDSSIDLV